MDTPPSRRGMLKIGAGALGAFALSSLAAPVAIAKTRPRAGVTRLNERSLAFYNLHTGESLKRTYWAEGKYIPEALGEINYVLRDFRTGDQHAIDPDLLDLLARLRARLDTAKPFQVISGYRSPKTNAMLREVSTGVAQHSMHTLGQAIDIRIEGRRLRNVRDAAWSLQRGGVGFYPASDFVHVDTGRIRFW